MESLVDSILALEQEAETIVANAQDQAREMAARVETEIGAYREDLARDVEQRLSALEVEKRAEYETESARVEAEQRARLETFGSLGPDRIQSQVDRILSRFRGE
ncbi:MAG: hypothetical protein HY319_09085 [Armatimonadetes bacterium]|nr:hypothetical protein [Armatimonadota bacterium]